MWATWLALGDITTLRKLEKFPRKYLNFPTGYGPMNRGGTDASKTHMWGLATHPPTWRLHTHMSRLCSRQLGGSKANIYIYMFLMHRDSQCNSKSMLCIHISKKSAGSTYVWLQNRIPGEILRYRGYKRNYVHTYILYILSIRRFICPLVIPTGVINSGHIYMKISYIPNS